MNIPGNFVRDIVFLRLSMHDETFWCVLKPVFDNNFVNSHFKECYIGC